LPLFSSDDLDDFRFGQARSGGLDFFKDLGERYDFHVNPITTVKQNQKGKVGSSAIRDFIVGGDLKKVERFLGRHASILGKVVRGDARGKTLGFPTANVIPENTLLPPNGSIVFDQTGSNPMY